MYSYLGLSNYSTNECHLYRLLEDPSSMTQLTYLHERMLSKTHCVQVNDIWLPKRVLIREGTCNFLILKPKKQISSTCEFSFRFKRHNSYLLIFTYWANFFESTMIELSAWRKYLKYKLMLWTKRLGTKIWNSFVKIREQGNSMQSTLLKWAH